MSNKFAAVIQMKSNTYMLGLTNFIIKPELQLVQETVLGNINTRSVLVTKIATDIRSLPPKFSLQTYPSGIPSNY